MPRIDPLSLLRCLSVLLGPNGGIKSKEEVSRLANLMTKFSKKLVSKCIYIQILKNTEPELLDQFMSAGGWKLIHTWLADGIQVKNWPLIQELLELLLLCPVDIERLKSNNCPKLVKGLSKEGSHEGVRIVANRLVEQWLKMVKGESVPSVAAVHAESIVPSTLPSAIYHSLQTNAVITANLNLSNSENAVSVQNSDSFVNETPLVVQSLPSQQQIVIQSSPLKSTHALTNAQDKPQNVTSISHSSVYKITIRDGKQVLTQVQTDASNINGISVNNIKTEHMSDFADNVLPIEDELHRSLDKNKETIEKSFIDDKNTVDSVSKDISSEVKENFDSSKTINETDAKNKDLKVEIDGSSDINKSMSDKENGEKRDDKKSVSRSSSVDKKSSNHALSSNKSSSKHSSSSSKHSSSSHRSSSHRSSSKSSSSSNSKDKSSKDKDRHHSSSSSKSSSSKSKSERDREKERERLKKDQAEKDKATLEKLQGQALSTKMGKIPKKKVDQEKSGDSSSRKSSTDSKDSYKENKDKADSKKSIPEKKNISISIENRKSQDQSTRPKTVKTFNSKFRSTGLEEEVKPPSRGVKKSITSSEKKVILPKIPLKRPSPLKETGPCDKKAKLSLDSPTTPPSDEKKGGIKLIPAKPKFPLKKFRRIKSDDYSSKVFKPGDQHHRD